MTKAAFFIIVTQPPSRRITTLGTMFIDEAYKKIRGASAIRHIVFYT
jgi:hypothetical protein